MPHRLPPDPQVHLHWVRETPSRALVLPVSQTLHSLGALPPCVQTAVRATALPTLELHLPPFRPSSEAGLEEWAAGLRFQRDAVGRLTATHIDDPQPLATMGFHQAIVLTFRALTGDATPLTLIAGAPPAPLLRQPLAARHVCATAGGLAKAPSERSHHYYPAYRAVALRAQAALRAAVPPAHLLTLQQFADRPHVLSLLAWSSAAPVVGRTVDQLGVDALNPELVERAQRGLEGRLATCLSEIWDLLNRQNVAAPCRDSYLPRHASRVNRHCQRHSKFIKLLFSNEMRLISALIKFCVRIPEWRKKGVSASAQIYREARAAWEAVDRHCRTFYQRHPHTPLSSLLLLEAVRILEAID